MRHLELGVPKSLGGAYVSLLGEWQVLRQWTSTGETPGEVPGSWNSVRLTGRSTGLVKAGEEWQ
jgi:hypothetical protein